MLVILALSYTLRVILATGQVKYNTFLFYLAYDVASYCFALALDDFDLITVHDPSSKEKRQSRDSNPGLRTQPLCYATPQR